MSYIWKEINDWLKMNIFAILFIIKNNMDKAPWSKKKKRWKKF